MMVAKSVRNFAPREEALLSRIRPDTWLAESFLLPAW
jgi:hypothetical protein